MERRIASLSAEVVDSESAKFTVPMLLLHGLWSTAALWRPFMGYLAHRGWQCSALQLRDTLSLATVSAEVRRAAATLSAPPVILGHDLGGLVALRLADAATAVVALAPLVLPPLAPRPPSSLAQAGTLIDRLLGRPLRAPRARFCPAYPAHAHTRRETPALIAELMQAPMDLAHDRVSIPCLIVAGADDPVTPVASARALAEHLGADLTVEAMGGHALPVDPGWERRVADIHRWLVRRLGQPLLALYDEAMEASDEPGR